MMYIRPRPPDVIGFPLPPPSCMIRMPRGCLAALLVPALVLLSAPLGAQQEPAQQEVRGLVTADGTGAPIKGALILLIDLDGNRVGGVLSASNGRFRVPVPDPGRYVLRAERLGYASMDTELIEVPAGTSVEQRIVSAMRPIQLAGLYLRGGRRCEVQPPVGLAVWEEVRCERSMYAVFLAPVAPPVSLVPELLSPSAGAVIPQDVVAAACGGKAQLLVAFDWSDAEHESGIREYEIEAYHQGSAFAAVDEFVAESTFLWDSCGYIADHNLYDWEWRVRARANSGELGDWTAYRPFSFAPCRRQYVSVCRNQ